MDKGAIGSRLKEARNMAHLTQEQLSEKVGIGTTYLSDIERGAKFPSLRLFISLVNALDISSDYILCGEIEAGKNYLSNDIAKKLEGLTPKQRLALSELIDTYIKNLD